MAVEELLGLVGASDMHGFVLQDGIGDRLCPVRILISRADKEHTLLRFARMMRDHLTLV